MPNYPSRRKSSLGQACCNTLAAWLRTQVDDSITVYERFPDASVQRGQSPTRTVTILRVGKRELEDLLGMEAINGATPTGAQVAGQNATVQYSIGIGHFTQKLQLHLEAQSDLDLDDIVDQLDDALNVGVSATLPATALDFLSNPPSPDDPVRHGLVLQFLPGDLFQGNVAYTFDDVDQVIDPGLLQKHMHGAVYSGEARGVFQRLTQAQQILQVTNGLTATVT